MKSRESKVKQRGREITKYVVIFLVLGGIILLFPRPQAIAKGKPIIFGAPLPLGDPTGVEAKRGAILAVEQINREGGIRLPDGCHPVKLEISDSRDLEPGVPVTEALLSVERLILDKKARFIVSGPERSEAWLAAMRLSKKYKVIMIAAAGAYSPAIGAKIAEDPNGKYKYCWDVQNDARTDVIHVIPLFKTFEKKWGWKKFYVMVQDVAHTRAAGAAVEKVLKKLGWQSLGMQRYPTGSNDFSLGLLEAKNKGADLIYISFEMPQVSILMRQWAELKVPALPIGLAPVASAKEFWRVTKGACEYFVANQFEAANGPAKPLNATTVKWFKGFVKRWRTEPGLHCGVPSYVSCWALKDAIERAGSTDPDKVVAALYKTDLSVPYGRLRFDAKSHKALVTDNPKTGMVTGWFQWQKKGVYVRGLGVHTRRVFVWPPAAATGSLKRPPWKK